MMMASRRLLVAITFAEHLQDTVLFYPSQMAYLDACIDEFNGLHRFVFHSLIYIFQVHFHLSMKSVDQNGFVS
jgi:hypothetical protein